MLSLWRVDVSAYVLLVPPGFRNALVQSEWTSSRASSGSTAAKVPQRPDVVLRFISGSAYPARERTSTGLPPGAA
eukprot:6136898-Lingulodinium_polyedra.AAC.1